MIDNRNTKTICLGCFGELNISRVCTSCNQQADDTPSPAHHIPSRTVLHRKYLLSKAIGEGGFGITYLAWDMLKCTKVAIKEYFPSAYVYRVSRSNSLGLKDKVNHIANSRSISRFMHEAKILASLKNTVGIVDVTDFFNTNKTSYIVMEYLDGQSLKNYHKQQGNLNIEQLYTLLTPIFDGLQIVHNKGLIHRDISPDNIIINSRNNAKLIDFGASKRVNYIENSNMSIVLKHGFAPEEQYRKNGEQGPWSDVYALASTIYYCMVGKLPPESVQRLYKDNIINPSNSGVSIDKTQEMVLMRALSVYAKNRYQSILEFKQALSKSIPKRPVSPIIIETKDGIDTPTPSKSRTNFYQNLLGRKNNKSK